jgi:XapX domain-containing protein
MKAYLVAPGGGGLVGMLYRALNLKSPAPPTVALIGLPGMPVGEHLLPLVRSLPGFDVNWATRGGL